MKLAALIAGVIAGIITVVLFLTLVSETVAKRYGAPLFVADHLGCIGTSLFIALATLTCALFWYAFSG